MTRPTMLAACWQKPHQITPVSRERPSPGPGEALVRVGAVGVCGSDLAIVAGKHPRARAPLVIGHELAGELVEVPPGDHGLEPGERVALYPLLTCGTCYACRNGIGHVCATLRVIGFDCDGGMAEYAVFPVENLLGLPDEMSWATGALIEPLAVCLHAQSIRPVASTERVVILGAGPIGLLTALSLRARGVSHLVISDVSSERLAIAAAAGVPAVDPSREDLPAHVQEMTGGDGADVLFEAAGVQATATQMTELVRPRGTIVNLSVFKEPPVVDLRTVNFRELSLVGSRVYTHQDFREAIALAPELPVERLVSHRLPLSEVARGFELLSRGGGASKVLFFPDPEPAR